MAGKKASKDAFVLRLEGQRNMETAADTHAQLSECSEKHQVFAVDCSGVTAADLTLVQLLLAARRSAQTKGGEVTLAKPATGPLAEVLSECGFRSHDGSTGEWTDPFWAASAAAAP